MGKRLRGVKRSMKIGDLVTIMPVIGTAMEGPIGVRDDDRNVFEEFGIIMEITEVLTNRYAHVWWFKYNTGIKGKPSEMIPCQYLKVI